MNFNYVIGFGVALVILGVVFSIGAVILGKLGQNDAISNDTVAQQVITDSKSGIQNATSLLGILGLTVIAGVVIAVVMTTFGGLQKGGAA